MRYFTFFSVFLWYIYITHLQISGIEQKQNFIKKLYELYYEHLDSLDASIAKENVSQSDEDGEFSLFHIYYFHFVLCVICQPKKYLIYQDNYSMLEKCISM